MADRPDASTGGALLGQPEIRRTVLAAFTGTLGAGVAPIGLVLLCRDAGLSYASVGVVLAGEAAGLVLGGPWRGRAVDRRGQRAALLGYGTVHVVLLAALLAAVRAGAPVMLTAACAAAASATFPPFNAVLRERWLVLLPDPRDRHRGFAAQAITQEAVFVVGPLVATATATLLDPAAIVGVMAACSTAGAVTLLRSAPREHRRPLSPAGGWLGALVAPGVRVVVLAHVPLGIALGAIELTSVAVAEQDGHRAHAGLLVAVFSLGSAAGGLWWGRRGRGRPDHALLWLSAAFLVAQLPLLAAGSFGGALPAFAVAGLAFAPLVATVYALLDGIARPGTTARRPHGSPPPWGSAASSGRPVPGRSSTGRRHAPDSRWR